jgi:hypothetical protein
MGDLVLITDGILLFNTVGTIDGDTIGWKLGIIDGPRLEGSSEGCKVGSLDGTIVGSLVGTTVR